MQLFAYNQHKILIRANQAHRQQDYDCLECRQTVRRRGGMHRQDHFYHVKPAQNCRQNGKSLVHLQIQKNLQSLLSEEQAIMEYSFNPIGRIADLVWLTEKIVFEIQCSPISAEEVMARNRDYASLGYQVVWILHDKRFNQRRLSGAEMVLADRLHYFTNIDAEGRGFIYDQYEFVDKGIRYQKLDPLVINLAIRKKITPLPFRFLREKVQKGGFCFEGDLINLCLMHPDSPYLQKAKQVDHLFQQPITTPIWRLKRFFHDYLVRPYNLFFQICLERICK